MSNRKEHYSKDNSPASPSADTDWFVKLKADSLTDGTNQAFLDWLQENPNNEQEYERCELAWELSGELENDPQIAALISQCDERIAQYHDQTQNRFYTKMGRLLRGLLAKRPLLTTGTLAITCIASIFALLVYLPQTYETKVGEQRLVDLSDGSRVTLNTNTKLTVSYHHDRREIALRQGEAVFDVAHDPNRPFEVLAANGLARAVGTRFNVSLEENLVTVSVLEGVVEVSTRIHDQKSIPNDIQDIDSATHSALLMKGQAVNYWEQGTIAEPFPAQLKRIEAWQRGKLEFDANLLVDVIKEHNRYSLKKIVISNNQLENLQVSGIFNAGDTEALLFALKETFGISALDRNNLILLVPKT
ncbi:MAG: FecR domain-containing protein [Pseudomonadales bacterium]|nr:FecR domain-containing protein [Pseudomonadales bacterium]